MLQKLVQTLGPFWSCQGAMGETLNKVADLSGKIHSCCAPGLVRVPTGKIPPQIKEML